jgi:arylformamidase
MPRIFDVTAPLTSDTPVYPGDPSFRLEPVQSIAKGDPYNLGRLALGTQTGTHVEAPYHFLSDGATVDQLPLEILMGKVRVVETLVRERIQR